MRDRSNNQREVPRPPKVAAAPTLPAKTSGHRRTHPKIHSARHELRLPASRRLAWFLLQLADRTLRIGSVLALLFGLVAACYLTLRRSSDLRTIPWLPHSLDPLIRWVDFHGYLRNIPAYALLALPVMVLYSSRPARAKAIALLALFAAVLEGMQYFIPSRWCEWQDVALSWVGLLLTWGLAECTRWTGYRLRRFLSNAGQRKRSQT